MKRYFILLVLFVAVLDFSSCDKIDPPYIDGDTGTVDTVECPIPTFPVDTNHIKTVLIEEYTGHTCVNCPSAGVVAHDILEDYGDSVILIAIHAGYFAQVESPNYTLDLNTTVGTELHTNFGISNNPAAIFNRKTIGGSLIFESYTGWETTFLTAQDTVPVLDMQMIAIYDEDDNDACIHIQTEYLVNLNRPLKISVYVTEDSLVGYQRNNNSSVGTTPEIPDYVFMHVLRGAVNGTWGTDLSTTDVPAGTKKISSFKLVLNSLWKPEHCHLVAFVYDANTQEILQATQVKLIP